MAGAMMEPADGFLRGLPPWTYAHAGLTRLEHERVLLPSWQLACHVSDVAQPGDYLTFDIGPESIMVLRDMSGTIRAFHNVCRHRAARLLEGSGSCPGAVTCRYHGWTYTLEGALRGLPVRESFPSLDRSAYGLLPVRMEIFASFVFVCLAGEPPSVASMWGDMAADFIPYQFEKMLSRADRPSRPVSHVHA
jgi:phenylpropionate dioxygenase-like ring-hydroxylating dioxygenase large terminal subunit